VDYESCQGYRFPVAHGPLISVEEMESEGERVSEMERRWYSIDCFHNDLVSTKSQFFYHTRRKFLLKGSIGIYLGLLETKGGRSLEASFSTRKI